MGIEAKHAYRFGYLKSDQWKAVRLEALVREKGKCQVCGEESIANDAHHVWYPKNIYETTERHLVILCRPCHDFIHAMLPECKTSDEELGLAEWARFKSAIAMWRNEKLAIFQTGEPYMKAKQLRDAYLEMKSRCADYERRLGFAGPDSKAPSVDAEVNHIISMVRKWAFAFKHSQSENKSIDISEE